MPIPAVQQREKVEGNADTQAMEMPAPLPKGLTRDRTFAFLTSRRQASPVKKIGGGGVESYVEFEEDGPGVAKEEGFSKMWRKFTKSLSSKFFPSQKLREVEGAEEEEDVGEEGIPRGKGADNAESQRDKKTLRRRMRQQEKDAQEGRLVHREHRWVNITQGFGRQDEYHMV